MGGAGIIRRRESSGRDAVMAEAIRIAPKTPAEERALDEEAETIRNRLITDTSLSDAERHRLHIRRAAILEWQNRFELPYERTQPTVESAQNIRPLTLEEEISSPVFGESLGPLLQERERLDQERLEQEKAEIFAEKARLRALGNDDGATQAGIGAK